MADRDNHVCSVYDDAEAVLAAGLEWLAHGLAAKERVVYVADRPAADLRADLAELGDVSGLMAIGALVLLPLRDLYPTGGPVDAESSLAFYAGQTQQALDDGFTGLRVFAEVTTLVSKPDWRPGHIAWEQIADRYMAEHPLAAFCAYNRGAIDARSAALLSCVHPIRHGDEPPAAFSLYAGEHGWALEGEVDFFQSDLLAAALDSAPGEPPLELDLAGLTFVDAAGARALRSRAGTVRNAPPVLRRLWDLIGAAPAGI